MLDLPLPRLQDLIRHAGLSNHKAPRIQAILRRIEQDFGQLSLDDLHAMSDQPVEDYLTSLLGVGLKTAKCVMMCALGRRQVLPVDTHVARVARHPSSVRRMLPPRNPSLPPVQSVYSPRQ